MLNILLSILILLLATLLAGIDILYKSIKDKKGNVKKFKIVSFFGIKIIIFEINKRK